MEKTGEDITSIILKTITDIPQIIFANQIFLMKLILEEKFLYKIVILKNWKT